jgi:hypothetical protein
MDLNCFHDTEISHPGLTGSTDRSTEKMVQRQMPTVRSGNRASTLTTSCAVRNMLYTTK